MKKYLLLTFCIAALITSCQRVEDLKDTVGLTDFKIVASSPEEIELGEPRIEGDTVFIPVLRGVALFPLSLSVEPIATPETEQILLGTSSIASFNDIVFQEGDIDSKVFYLVAKSGYTRAYYIKLDIADQNRHSEFQQLTINGCSTSGAMLPPQAFIKPLDAQIDIYMMGYSIPTTIASTAILSEGALLYDLNDQPVDPNNVLLSYQNPTDTARFYIVAQSGKKQEWKVCLKPAKAVTGSEEGHILSAVSIQPDKLSAEIQTPGYTVLETGVDNTSATTGTVTFSITPATTFTQLDIVPNIGLAGNSYTLGYETAAPLQFTSYSSTNSLYVLDNRTGYYKQWTFKVTEGNVTDLHAFPFTYTDNSGGTSFINLASEAKIDNFSNTVTLYVTKLNAAYFPLSVTPGAIVVSPGATTDAGAMTLTGMNDVYNFTISSGSKTESWRVILQPAPTIRTKADIENFSISSSSASGITSGNVTIYKDKGEIAIDIVNVADTVVFAPTLQLQPAISLSDGANFSGYQHGDIITFTTFWDTPTINVIAENGTEKQWKVRLVNKPQLDNSNFELWVVEPVNIPTLDPTPGKGRGWATANNSFVKGTKQIENGANGSAAQMVTEVANYPKNLLTAATTFLGYFKVNLAGMNNPRSMTKFGIPFQAYPSAIKIDAKYEPGPQLQKSISSGFLQYKLEDIEGADKGQIWVELIHWTGAVDQLDYSGEAKAGVHVLSRGEHTFTQASDWQRLTIPLEKTAEYDLYRPTHLVVVMSSSIDGHLFIAAPGSTLTVDNFELTY